MATESQGPETPHKKPSIASVLVPVAIILAGVLFALGYLRGRDSSSHQHDSGRVVRKVGEAIPDLSFHTLDGKVVKLSELKSKVTLINFWATWCPPCVKEMPSLQKLSTEYAARGLTVIGINMDDNPEVVLAPFLAKHEIKFSSYIDPKGEIAEMIGVSGLPLTLVVDSERKLLLEHTGDEEWFDAHYRRQFEIWLGEKASQ